jgi:hypothetical protein
LTKIEEVQREKEREEIFEATRNSYWTAMESVFALQEETLRFAQSLIEDSAETASHGVQRNRAMAQALVERSRRQREAVEALLSASAKAYTDLVYVPFYRYHRQALETLAPTGASETSQEAESSQAVQSLPIQNYDSLNVSEVSQEVERNGLSVEDLKRLKSHEQANKYRRTLIELFDRGIENAPSYT